MPQRKRYPNRGKLIMTYKPQKNVAEVMTWCLEQVQSLPYNATLRWLFYQAYQASKSGMVPWELPGGKKAYKTFIRWTSRVRKNFWNGWVPNTLLDDQRNIVQRGGGYDTPSGWFDHFRREVCVLDKRLTQEKIVIICFEAEAMHAQFEYLTDGYFVSLVPFRGDASIEQKWRLAKWIEELVEYYEKPVKILYYGDLDPKGAEIPENAMRDIKKWCQVPFGYEHIGLKDEHVKQWNLPENPDKHGFQWEALNNEQATELIQGTLNHEINLGEIAKILKIENETTARWKEVIEEILD